MDIRSHGNIWIYIHANILFIILHFSIIQSINRGAKFQWMLPVKITRVQGWFWLKIWLKLSFFFIQSIDKIHVFHTTFWQNLCLFRDLLTKFDFFMQLFNTICIFTQVFNEICTSFMIFKKFVPFQQSFA